MGHEVTFAYVPYDHGSEDYDAMERYLRGHLRILTAQPPPFPRPVGRIRRKVARTLRLPAAHAWDVDEWFDNGLLTQLTRIQDVEQYDAALIEYVFLSKVISVLPKAVRTIIDMHDLFGGRHRYYLNNGMAPAWFSTTSQQEIKALGRADAVIAIQEQEAEYLRHYGLREVFCVGHISTQQYTPLADPGEARILFVGSDNPINIQGLEWFIHSVLPQIRAAMPTSQFMIAGPAGYEHRWPDDIVILGKVDSIVTAYSDATVVVNPVFFGTGLAVKTIEALSFGKAVVVTAAGARGLDSEFRTAMVIARDCNGFARGVIALLQSQAARAQLSANAFATMKRWRRRQLAALDAALRGSESN
jgi:glycosyltransferase involved in cell wall biosynthesis